MVSRTSRCGSALGVGALLVGVAGFFHPVLTGGASAQLDAIASTEHWRVIHWSIALGFVVLVGGLALASAIHHTTPAEIAARVGATVAVFGYAVSLVGVLFMLSAARELAEAHAATGDAAFLYDMLHPFALAALRLGAFAVSVALCAFGLAIRSGALWPRWLGSAALLAGAIGAAIGVLVHEHSPMTIGGIALAAAWQLLAGVVLLGREVHSHRQDRCRIGSLTAGTAG